MKTRVSLWRAWSGLPCLLLTASAALATNGMNLDAYGTKAAAMGGASYAFDNGNGAMMNNPATLGARREGMNVSLGLSVLAPDIAAGMRSPVAGSVTVDSENNAFFMPSLAMVRKSGRFTYGAGLYPQGGMGVDWGDRFTGKGVVQRSEVGCSRIMAPLAYAVTDNLTVAVQLEYAWAGLDLRMINPQTGEYYSMSDSSDFTGKARGEAWPYKLGLHYRMNRAVALGIAYHSRVDLSDMEAEGYVNTPFQPVRFKVADPEWPETYGAGLAWHAQDFLLLAADVKLIRWSKTLTTFRLEVDGQPVFGSAGAPQDWSDQTVLMLGIQYMLTPELALRAGYNHAASPVPDNTLNPLAPAIVTSHYAAGLGWQWKRDHVINLACTYAPRVSQTNPDMFGPGVSGEMSHSQWIWRIEYDYSF